MCWQHDATAWGLVTSHPFAIKAMETASKRQCDPTLIAAHATSLVKTARVPYASASSIRCTSTQSLIDTRFYVDHSEVNAIVAELPNWRLGNLGEGDEFFAFTFPTCQ